MINKNILTKIDIMILTSIYLTSFAVFTSIAAINAGVILTIIFWLIKVAMNYKIIREYDFHGFLFIMSVFVLSFFLSGINNWNSEIITNKFLFSALFFFIFINEVKSRKQLNKILVIIFSSSLIASLFGLYQHFYLGIPRVKGFSFSLTFGNMIAVMIMFLSVYIIWGDLKYRTKIILTVIDIIFILNLLYTKSRGAWLGFIGGVFVLGLLKNKKIIIIFLIIMTLSFMFLPPQYINRFKSSFDISYDMKNNRSNTLRIEMWKTALKIIRDYPLFGLGYDNYETSLSDPYKIDVIDQERFIHVHNTFLQFGAEIGLFGLVSFVFLIYFVLKKLYILYKDNKGNIKLFHLASIVSVFIYLLQGMTQYNFGKTEPLSFFWIIIALNILCNKYDSLLN